VEDDGEFSKLNEVQRNKDGMTKVAPVNHEGVISEATRWSIGNQMYDESYEELFASDFNSNN